MFKFIHAADLHLDSPLRGLEKYDGAPLEEIRSATRRALENLVQLALDEGVAFVLIAGDIYDGDWNDHRTGLFFREQMSRLRAAEVPVYTITGNHDAANRMTKSLKLPENVRCLSTKKPETVVLESCAVAIHGQGFATAAVLDNLSLGYPAATPGAYNVGLLHTCATGGEGHASYAPCTLADLQRKQYDYWALGHVHQRASLCDEGQIHFPGNLQGRHIRETGTKGCLLVTVDDALRSQTRFEPLDVFRWQRCPLDAAGARTPEDVLELFDRQLVGLLSEAGGRPLAVRVEIQGASEAHAALNATIDRWTNELRALATDRSAGQVWLEKVKFKTRPRTLDEDLLADDGPLRELLSAIAEAQGNDLALAELGKELDDLRRKLPAELREGDQAMSLDDPDWLREMLGQAQPLLLSRLRGGDAS